MSDAEAMVVIAVIAAVVILRVVDAKEAGAREAGYAAGQGAIDELGKQARNLLNNPPASFGDLVR